MKKIALLLLLTAAGLSSCNKEQNGQAKQCNNGPFRYVAGDKGFIIPTAITFNTDGVNDVFRPITNMDPSVFALRIYNSKGVKVYQYSPGWGWPDYGDTTADYKSYEYYVEVTIMDDSGMHTGCAPLFVLRNKTTGSNCVGARQEDTGRYLFPNQIDPRDWTVKYNHGECLVF